MPDEIAFFEIFPWNENFETGIEEIDEQHKVLVQILNRLAANLANISDDVILNDIFDELADYAAYHFKSEERIWNKYYKDDEWNINHHDSHGSFMNEVMEIKNNNGGREVDDVIYDIVSFLSKWLAYHILDTDKRMAMGVNMISSGKTIEESKLIANDTMNGSMKVIIETVLSMYETLSTRTLDLMREKARRQQAEEKLKLSEERWKFILDGGSNNVWDWDFEKNTLEKSDDEMSIFDIVNSSIYNNNDRVIHPADIKAIERDLQAHIDGKTKFYSNKHRVYKSNGSWSWVHSRGKVVSRDSNGVPLRMVGTHADITEKELASLIYNNSSQSMFICNKNNEIISTNPAFSKITGYAQNEVIGLEW